MVIFNAAFVARARTFAAALDAIAASPASSIGSSSAVASSRAMSSARSLVATHVVSSAGRFMVKRRAVVPTITRSLS